MYGLAQALLLGASGSAQFVWDNLTGVTAFYGSEFSPPPTAYAQARVVVFGFPSTHVNTNYFWGPSGTTGPASTTNQGRWWGEGSEFDPDIGVGKVVRFMQMAGPPGLITNDAGNPIIPNWTPLGGIVGHVARIRQTGYGTTSSTLQIQFAHGAPEDNPAPEFIVNIDMSATVQA